MFKGVGFALGACFIWGLIFVVPQFMIGFSSIEVALGRYLVYGVISALIFIKSMFGERTRYPLSIWLKALNFSLICTIAYYTFVVLALRYSTPAICALILGISPITIAFLGNWQQKEISFRSLIIPSILILTGLTVINFPHLESGDSPSSYMLGLMFGFLALAAWSWYAVANSQFIKQGEVSSSDWSTLIGVATLLWVIVFTAFLGFFFEDQLHLEKYFVFNEELIRFLIGSAILGILCSWVGAFLWNKASLHLPVSMAGQLTVFETLFGVIFVYIASESLPTFMDSIGMGILLAAIVYGITVFTKKKGIVEEELVLPPAGTH